MIHCLKCKTQTETNDVKIVTLINNILAETGTCVVCGTEKFKLVKSDNVISSGDLVCVIKSVTKHF